MHCPDLGADQRKFLEEEYAREQSASDGEIYYNLRHHQRQRNLGLEMRWRSRLQGRRAGNLQSLIGNQDLKDVVESFDALLDIPGLWDGMRLTSLHKMVAMKCDTVGYATMCVALADRLVTGTSQVLTSHPQDLVAVGWRRRGCNGQDRFSDGHGTGVESAASITTRRGNLTGSDE